MASKRTQVAPEPVLKSIDEVGAALGELCEIEATITTKEAKVTKRVKKLRDALESVLKDSRAKKARLEHDIEEYCAANRDSIFPKDKKSLELAHGTVGFRKNPKSVVVSKKNNWTIKAAIEAIKVQFAHRKKQWLRTTEDLNREVLVTVDPEDLAKIGLEIKEKELFGYTLKNEKLAELPTQNT